VRPSGPCAAVRTRTLAAADRRSPRSHAPTASSAPAFDADTLAGLTAAFGTTPLRTSEGGEQVDTTAIRAIRAILRDSARSHGHELGMLEGAHAHAIWQPAPGAAALTA
jgi:hypothetical protein